MKASAAFYYHPDGFETKRSNLMGRHAAGEEFLKAYARYSGANDLHCYAKEQKHFEHFVEKIKQSTSAPKQCFWVPWDKAAALEKPGCLFMPGPNMENLAWQRRHGNARSYSLCGITHTTATQAVMDALGQFLLAPYQPWDAVICTSKSVKQMVENVVSDYGDYLNDKFSLGKKPKTPLQLPVIPLGVDCSAFAPGEESIKKSRATWRETLKIADEDFAALFVGRLSFHSKAHPLPMYRGLQTACEQTGKKVHLLMCGWFESDSVKAEFVKAAKEFCPSVNVIFVDGRKPEVRKTIWFAADAFMSLSDNVQETFGLTPVEAMAAGLPVIISSWDGYRETARHDIDGFLIPTMLPPPGFAADVALSNAIGATSYPEYIGYQSQFTLVDDAAVAQACVALIESPALRKKMGDAGKQRAQSEFDWSHIIGKYQELWAHLSELRGSAGEQAVRNAQAPANPLRQDPLRIFQHYADDMIRPSTIVSANARTNADAFEKLKDHRMATFAANKVARISEINEIFELLKKRQSLSMEEISNATNPERRKSVILTIAWLAKMGLVELNGAGKRTLASVQ